MIKKNVILCLYGVLGFNGLLGASENDPSSAHFFDKANPIIVSGEEVLRGFKTGLPLARKVWKASRPLRTMVESERRALSILSGSNDHLEVKPFIDEAEMMTKETRSLRLPYSHTSARALRAGLQRQLDFANDITLAFIAVEEDLKKLVARPRYSSYGKIESLWVEEFPAARRALAPFRWEVKKKIAALDKLLAEDGASDEVPGPFQLFDFQDALDRVETQVSDLRAVALPTDPKEKALFLAAQEKLAKTLQKDVKAIMEFVNKMMKEGEELPESEFFLREKYSATAKAAAAYFYGLLKLHSEVQSVISELREEPVQDEQKDEGNNEGGKQAPPKAPSSPGAPGEDAHFEKEMNRFYERDSQKRSEMDATRESLERHAHAETLERGALAHQTSERNRALEAEEERGWNRVRSEDESVKNSLQAAAARNSSSLDEGARRSAETTANVRREGSQGYAETGKNVSDALEREESEALRVGAESATLRIGEKDSKKKGLTIGDVLSALKDDSSKENDEAQGPVTQEPSLPENAEKKEPSTQTPPRSKAQKPRAPSSKDSLPEEVPEIRIVEDEEFLYHSKPNLRNLDEQKRGMLIETYNIFSPSEEAEALNKYLENKNDVFWELMKEGTWSRFKKWFESE